MTFNKVLVANRGEIALRVIGGAAALGHATVAIYSEADAGALHVLEADEAVCIGAAPATESYLSIEHILAAARASGAEAIHPGYGFLAENAAFARAVEEAGLVFVGPTPDAIELMGSKRKAKQRMVAAGVPCVPGYQGDRQDDATLTTEARGIGFPLMVKASAGGGGRGIRLIEREAALPDAISAARSEAGNAFGSDELILEKAVINARHVEVQVFADTHGNVVHMGERDCSVQRRHQKVVEEAPSPAVNAALRAKMGKAAVDAATAIGYRGAGTVEFLLDASGAFYFMEMNTRLQVEHRVTEMITGLDLVEWQLRVAAGEPLPLRQDEIAFHGHAMEVRLCAEDPTAGFLPQTGRVRAWRAAASPGIQVDHCLQVGSEISPWYDSLVAKLIAWGPNRAAARTRLASALDHTVLLGVTHNKSFLAAILRHAVFADGDFGTGFIDQHLPQAVGATAAPSTQHVALAGAIMHAHAAMALAQACNIGRGRVNWHSGNAVAMPGALACGGRTWDLRIDAAPGGHYRLSVEGGDLIPIDLRHFGETTCDYVCDAVLGHADYVCAGPDLWLAVDGQTWMFADKLLQPPAIDTGSGSGRIVAPMDGRILAVDVVAGEPVEAGRKLLVLEAMKMEFRLEADIDGVVEAVSCAAGDQVAARQLLLTITPAGE